VQNSQGVCSASPLLALNEEVVSVNPVYVKAGVASHKVCLGVTNGFVLNAQREEKTQL